VLDLELRVEVRLGVGNGGARDADRVLAGHPGAAWRASQPGALSSSICKLQTPPKEQEPTALVVVMGVPRRGGPASTRSSPTASIASSTRVHGPPLAQHSATVQVERATPPQRAAARCRCRAAPHPPHARSCSPHRHPWRTRKRTGVRG
jgi:hypothetical protein